MWRSCGGRVGGASGSEKTAVLWMRWGRGMDGSEDPEMNP